MSELTAARMSLHGIPAQYQSFELVGFPGDKDARNFVQEYILSLEDNFRNGRGIVFYGPNGTGKTSLGCMILKAALRVDHSAQVGAWPLILDARTQAWNNPAALQEFRLRIFHTEFLQIDDLGKEVGSGKELSVSVLDMVLRHRAGRNRPTILTTNADPVRIRQVYGDSVASLLNGRFSAVPVLGADLREIWT